MEPSYTEESPLNWSSFSDFVKEIKPGQIALGLFEALPEIMFWVKDAEGCFVFVNQAYGELLGISPENIVGQKDSDLFSQEMARVYQQDDEQVRKSGESIHNKIELVTRRAGGMEWRMTSKIPLWGKDDFIMGTAGISRKLETLEEEPLPTPYAAMSKVVEYVHQNLGEQLSVEDLARLAGMSASTLERRFRSHLGTSPKKFVLQSKISAACKRLLSSAMTVGEIAESLGYYDHASFTRAFTTATHMSPTEYRKYYRNG